MMLHAKYLGSVPCGFRQEAFFMFFFFVINLCKTCDPVAGFFGNKGII